jgi:hypothetical protein
MTNDAEKRILKDILDETIQNISYHVGALIKRMDTEPESSEAKFVKKVLNWRADEKKSLWLCKIFNRNYNNNDVAFNPTGVNFLYELNSFAQNHFGDPQYNHHFTIGWRHSCEVEVDKNDRYSRPYIKAWLFRHNNKDSQITVGGSHDPALLIEIMDIYEQREVEAIEEANERNKASLWHGSWQRYLSKPNLKPDTVVSRKT